LGRTAALLICGSVTEKLRNHGVTLSSLTLEVWRPPSAFGVFDWLQVTDFNGSVLGVLFGCLCSHFYSLLCVSGTECSFGALTLVFDWGEPPPLLGCGSLTEKLGMGNKKTAPRDRTTVRLFNPLLFFPTAATFGVFDWLQVFDFDFLTHFILLSCFGFLFRLCQWHRMANDARL
jgi:hypothetical protein